MSKAVPAGLRLLTHSTNQRPIEKLTTHQMNGRRNRSCSAPPLGNNSRGRSRTRRCSSPILKETQQTRGRSRILTNSVDGRTNVVLIEEGRALKDQNRAYSKLCEAPEDSKREWNKRMPEGHLVVYTDGSYKGNLSGFGIYMGPNHPLNRSQKIPDPPHNSMRPEILAIVQALKNILEWDEYNDEPVIIRTDSLAAVQAINGIAQLSNFAEEIQEIRQLSSQIGGSVEFQHVYAHDGDPGNEAADLLAKQTVMASRGGRSRSRDRSRERGRSRSRDNNRDHIRTHSATIQGSNSSA